MLPKGSKLYSEYTKDNYVKLEDEEWAWWALEDESLPVEKQMQVRLTDENAKRGYGTHELVN